MNEEVEISAASVPTGEHPCYGFTIRRFSLGDLDSDSDVLLDQPARFTDC